MGYMHISNLYRPEAQDILLFKEVYALEKIHGTSSHIGWSPTEAKLTFFSGGTKHETFVKLFDQEKLIQAFLATGITDRDITIYGESYGGKEQGMSPTYGTVGKFVAFDVQIGKSWLSVDKADKFVTDIGLEFVSYVKVSTDLAALDAARDADSVQAIRNGVGPGKKMEGVVLRPLVEFTKNNGERVIVKHKRDEFKETATPRQVDPAKAKVFAEAQAVAEEYVVSMRLEHVLQKIPNHSIEQMKNIIAAMVEDINREGAGEFVPSPDVDKAIGKRTAVLYKEYLNKNIPR